MVQCLIKRKIYIAIACDNLDMSWRSTRGKQMRCDPGRNNFEGKNALSTRESSCISDMFVFWNKIPRRGLKLFVIFKIWNCSLSVEKILNTTRDSVWSLSPVQKQTSQYEIRLLLQNRENIYHLSVSSSMIYGTPWPQRQKASSFSRFSCQNFCRTNSKATCRE